MDSLLTQLIENFKSTKGLKITDSSDMFLAEKDLLEFLILSPLQLQGLSPLSFLLAEAHPAARRVHEPAAAAATASADGLYLPQGPAWVRPSPPQTIR